MWWWEKEWEKRARSLPYATQNLPLCVHFHLLFSHIYTCMVCIRAEHNTHTHIINNTFSYCYSGRRNETIDTRKKNVERRERGKSKGHNCPLGGIFIHQRGPEKLILFTLAHTHIFQSKKRGKKSLVSTTFIFILFLCLPSKFYSQSSNRNIGVT